MRGHSMRTPGQRQQNFAQESMINELAAAAKVDPIQFRLNNTSAPRLIAVLNAVEGGFRLGDSAVAELEGGNHRLEGDHRPGLQSDAAVGRLLGLRRQGVGRPEDRKDLGHDTSLRSSILVSSSIRSS